MNYKKSIFITFFLLAATAANAQSSRFGITAGLMIANEKTEFSGNEVKGSDEGPYVGIYLELPLREKLSLLLK